LSDEYEGADIYRLLKSPIRRKIILLLDSRRELTAAQLKDLLDISYGTLYYHLDFLKPLVDQVGRGRYALNERGREIADRLRRELRIRSDVKGRPSPLAFFERVAASPFRYVPLGALAAGLYLFLSKVIPVKSVLLFLVFPGEHGFYSSLLSMIITLAYFASIGKVLGRGDGGFGGLSVICLMSYAPIDVFLLSILTLNAFGAGVQAMVPFFKFFFIAVHVIQLVILAAGLTYSRGISWEKTLTVSLFLSYLSLLASSSGIF